MKYKEIKPQESLKNFVQCFWYYETAGKGIEHTILPDGYLDLIAEFEGGVFKTLKLTGVWTKPKNIYYF